MLHEGSGAGRHTAAERQGVADAPAAGRLRKIAVVVVHGVGDQKPGEPVRAVGNLLLSSQKQDCGSVGELAPRTVRIPLRKVAVAGRVETPRKRGMFTFDERSPYARSKLHQARATPGPGPGLRSPEGDAPPPQGQSAGRGARNDAGTQDGGDAGYEFMRAQLAGYKPAAAGDKEELAYEVACLEGYVRDGQGKPVARLDMYEMFWADLGKIGTGILSVFGHLYQLLFHLPSLGRQTADFTAIEQPGKWAWQAFMRSRNAAVRVLTLAVPILNLILVIASLVALSGAPRLQRYQPWAAAGLAVLLSIGAVLAWLWKKPPPTTVSWYLRPIAAGAVLVGLSLTAACAYPNHALAIEAWLAGCVAALVVLGRYDKFRPGALGCGLVGIAAASAWFGCESWTAHGSAAGNATIGLHVIQLGLCALRISWVLVALCFAGALAASAWALVSTRPADRRRSARGVWTAHTTLGLSSALVLILNLSLWSAVIQFAAKPLLQPDPQGNPVTVQQLCNGHPCADLTLQQPCARIQPLPVGKFWQEPDTACAVDLANELITVHAGWGFVLSLCGLAVVLLVAVWGLAPSIVAEIDPPQRSKTERARRFGRWLTCGMSVIGRCVFLLGPLLVGGVLWSAVLAGHGHSPILFWISDLAVFALVGGRQWLSSVGVILGIMLEIDNYIREHPTESAPRARIAERFASLLRHIGQDRRHGLAGYDAVIFVAHSQGTVVTADLLRFLAMERRLPEAQHEPALRWLEWTPICLFTMGCPLRQLYGWCFPNLYDWAMPPATAAAGSWLPGNVRWLNAYRSGDYVGRYLWAPPEHPDVWTRWPAGAAGLMHFVNGAGTQAEGCIGEGAHTHYWDATAGDVAALLQGLVVSSLGEPFSPFPPG